MATPTIGGLSDVPVIINVTSLRSSERECSSPDRFFRQYPSDCLWKEDSLRVVLNVYSKLRECNPKLSSREITHLTAEMTGTSFDTVLEAKQSFKQLRWTHAAFLPEQLQPAKRTRARRKRKDNNATSAGASTKKWKEDDIEQKLRALEETEGKAENEESTVEDDRLRKKIKQEQDSEDQEVEEEVEDEEELEEETDYVAGYFDNGESYLDEEDDNLDDGPVY
ncbi:DNA-directed RNA polymerase III subunit RPC7-like isoform X5 [Ornithodoros turicata]|uniref:DNA-directed RNA polymerase III subunit RPC7-like isoform X5 n=1 Tax=Ornithodoros turicata TaxID=34597 RepID=UPI0031397309